MGKKVMNARHSGSIGCSTIVAICLFSPWLYAGPLPITVLDRVAAIGRKEATPGPNLGNWVGEATGFFYGKFDHKEGDKSAYRLFLVTNRHVIEEHIVATNGPLRLRLNPKSGGSVREYDFPLVVNGVATWRAHPDPLVDVAVVNLNATWLEQTGIKFDYFHSDIDSLSRSKAKEIGLAEGYGVFVLGLRPYGDVYLKVLME